MPEKDFMRNCTTVSLQYKKAPGYMAQAVNPGRKQREFGKGFSLFTRKLMEGRRESVKDTLQIYISHLLSDEEMNAVVEETGAGVECIDFSISENLDHLERSLRDYEKRLKRIGTEKLTLHGPFLDLNPMTFDREIQKVTEKRYAQAYKAAEYLGASKIVYHTCLYPDAYLLMGWAERMADFFGSFLEDRSTVEVVIENVFDRAWEPMAEMAERVSRANFRLCLDMGHAHCFSPVSVTQWAQGLEKYITHVHVHDNLKDRDSHLGLGEGNLPYEEVIGLLSHKKAVTYTIECSKKEKVLRSYQELRRLLGSS